LYDGAPSCRTNKVAFLGVYFTGKFSLTIMVGFAEMECSILNEQQRNGIEVAKKKGKYVGRVKKYHEKHAGINHSFTLYKSEEYTIKEICEITNVSKSNFYRKLHELQLVRVKTL
jgi:DNA invertase Pin-like site-specific DNA recombinase